MSKDDIKPKKSKNIKQSSQNYFALFVVAAVFFGMAVQLKLSKTTVTLDWPVLVFVVVVVGVWVLDILRKAIK